VQQFHRAIDTPQKIRSVHSTGIDNDLRRNHSLVVEMDSYSLLNLC